VALGLSVLAAPAVASASTGLQLAVPVVTPSVTGTMTVGTPMTMTIAPGSATDHVWGYAWTWGPAQPLPVSSHLPTCGSIEGGLHVVCGSSVSVRVSPESSPLDFFNVWALDGTGNASSRTTVEVFTVHDVATLYPVTHQWTTDQFGTVAAAARCAAGRVTVACVPDTAGIDSQHPNGAHPLLLPPGVAWDGSGGDFPGIPGVLTFGSGNRLPAGTLGAVVDTKQSFSVGAMLNPAASPVGAPMTAIAQEGPGGTGFELGLTADNRGQFRVHLAAGDAVAVANTTAGTGYPVYVAGVADTINHEIRLYVNGLAASAGFTPPRGHAPDGVATVGGRLDRTGVAQRWIGTIGNPVLAQAPLTNDDLARLSYEMFFPYPDDGLN
jgi:hypothetical protein